MIGGDTTQNMQSSFPEINCVMLHLVGYIFEYTGCGAGDDLF